MSLRAGVRRCWGLNAGDGLPTDAFGLDLDYQPDLVAPLVPGVRSAGVLQGERLDRGFATFAGHLDYPAACLVVAARRGRRRDRKATRRSRSKSRAFCIPCRY